MVSKTQKSAIVNQLGSNNNDTGKAEVQIGILTHDIQNLTIHLNSHKKDVPTRRALLKKVSQRRHLLDYLMKHDTQRYKNIITLLGIRK